MIVKMRRVCVRVGLIKRNEDFSIQVRAIYHLLVVVLNYFRMFQSCEIAISAALNPGKFIYPGQFK